MNDTLVAEMRHSDEWNRVILEEESILNVASQSASASYVRELAKAVPYIHRSFPVLLLSAKQH